MVTSRNQEIKNAGIPSLSFNRSRHSYQKNHKTTYNTGMLVPIYANELLQPGDTMKMKLSLVIRMNTPYQPVMDNAYHDTYAFKIDWLDIWKYTKEFWGENTQGAWAQTTEYITPRISIPKGTKVTAHSLLAYLGFPQKTYTNGGTFGGGLSVAGAIMTYNEWFRDQNYIAPLNANEEGTTIVYNANDFTKGGTVPNVAKLHDRFTSGLPEPQKGDALTMPVGTTAPVYSYQNVAATLTDGTNAYVLAGGFNPVTGGGKYGIATGTHYNNMNPGQLTPLLAVGGGSSSNNNPALGFISDANNTMFYADLADAVGAAFSAQRVVVAANHILEGMAIYGTRYREIIKGMWGVNSSDTAQHIPEYLGGRRTPINVEQVTQTSAGNGNIGDTGAMSITADLYDVFTKSFTEHSLVMVFACIRTDQTYGQGLARQYFKERRLDYYWNELAHISFQPVYRGEIYLTGDETQDKAAFSFLPCFNEYRSEVNMLTGMFNPEYTDTQGNNTWLKEWTYANKLANAPVMGQEWIEETPTNMDRTLTVQSSAADQFICDYEFFIEKWSEVPAFGTPGLKRF